MSTQCSDNDSDRSSPEREISIQSKDQLTTKGNCISSDSMGNRRNILHSSCNQINQQKHALFEKYQAMVSDEYWKSRLAEAKLLSNRLAKHRSRFLSNNFLLLFPIIEVDEESSNVGSPR